MKASKKASEKTAQVHEYRILVVPDWDYDIENIVGCAEDDARADIVATIAEYGVTGYIVESRKLGMCEGCCSGPHEYEWEDVDSCFGFIGNDVEYMLAQARENLPEGIEAEVLSDIQLSA